MEDLLEKDCIVIANECELLNLCYEYRIPCKAIHTSFFHHDSTKYAFIISRTGIKECDSSVPPELTCFKTVESLKHYLFKHALFNSKIVVHKESYHIYLKTIKILKKLGIKVVKDKTYFEEADHFYISCGRFIELSYFGCKCVVTMTNGLQFKASVFLNALKGFYKNKNDYKKHITYYQSMVGEEL